MSAPGGPATRGSGRSAGGNDDAPTGRPRRPRRGAPAIDRGPRPIAEALDDVVAGVTPRRQRRAGPAEARGTGQEEAPMPSAAVWGTVFSRWEDLVGASLARHARPLRLEAGVLVVAVDLPPWATQVRALAPGILARITERTGEALERLEVVIRP